MGAPIVLAPAKVDPSLDIAPYRQLAAQLRFRIARGALKPGSTLPSVRAAAEQWRVHYNTAWKAYSLLADEGFLVTEPRKPSRVASIDRWHFTDSEAFEPFLRSVRAEARRRFGASVDQVVDGLRSLSAAAGAHAGPVWVVECSRGLAETLAGQVRTRWGVDARPWTIDRLPELAEGPIVATLYHLSDLQDFARDRARDVRFVPVQVDLEPIEQLLATTSGKAPLRLCGVECDSAFAIASEVRDSLGKDIDIRISVESEPEALLSWLNDGHPLLISPQLWDRLDATQRSLVNVVPYRTLIPRQDLEELGADMGWT